ncbi:unnamed protein product [Rhizophagus irregularis]|nr:unnamed protein product [Rhizophagus irregularis]CAB5363887.1 unnamed protein product [Rhizophagus irregularis]
MPLNNNNISSSEDENFLKDFLKEFYRQIIKIDNYTSIENILTEWIQEFFDNNNKNSEKILKLMENHEENENWFSSLIGFFYDNDIGIINNYNLINKDKSFKYYKLSIDKYEKDENKKLFSIYQLLNIIISKFLLSIYYYKDIILYKRDFIIKEYVSLENNHVMSHNQFENFNGLKMINLCKDEISVMENYFELQDNDEHNENQIDYIKKKESIDLNNLGYCYQYGIAGMG